MGELIPGEFAIRAFDTNTYVSWKNDPFVDTSANTITDTEKFTFTAYTPQYTLIQALNGQYVTVPSEGGLTLPAVGTEETSLFTLIGPQAMENVWDSAAPPICFGYNIRTRYGPFVSAVNGGNVVGANAFLTEVTVAQDWEMFSILKSGDLGSGYKYYIKPFGEQIWQPALPGGVGEIFTVIQAEPPSSGGYVFQLYNGFNYLTANGGGGVDGASPGAVPFSTDRWKPLSWEVFNIVDQGDATYFIQTTSGFYVGYEQGSGNISTDIGTPDTPPPGWITKFEFLMLRTPVHGDILLAIP
jgi:hypothetical protein